MNKNIILNESINIVYMLANQLVKHVIMLDRMYFQCYINGLLFYYYIEKFGLVHRPYYVSK